MIAACFVSDREDLYLPECQASFGRHVLGADAWHTIDDREHRLGMAGAVRAAWAWALDAGCDYLFHVEEDFTFNQTISLEALRTVLEQRPMLAQVVLKRQPWNDEEKAAGDMVEANPGEYIAHPYGPWLEHSRIFSLNPCLIPRRVLELGWPDGNEAGFTQRCLDRGFRFAMFGERHCPPQVTHVGQVRRAGWRL